VPTWRLHVPPSVVDFNATYTQSPGCIPFVGSSMSSSCRNRWSCQGPGTRHSRRLQSSTRWGRPRSRSGCFGHPVPDWRRVTLGPQYCWNSAAQPHRPLLWQFCMVESPTIQSVIFLLGSTGPHRGWVRSRRQRRHRPQFRRLRRSPRRRLFRRLFRLRRPFPPLAPPAPPPAPATPPSGLRGLPPALLLSPPAPPVVLLEPPGIPPVLPPVSLAPPVVPPLLAPPLAATPPVAEGVPPVTTEPPVATELLVTTEPPVATVLPRVSDASPDSAGGWLLPPCGSGLPLDELQPSPREPLRSGRRRADEDLPCCDDLLVVDCVAEAV